MIVLRWFLRDQRRLFGWWVLGMLATIVLTVALYPSIRDQPGLAETVESLPEVVRTLFGLSDAVSILSPAGYLHGRLFATIFPLLLIILGINLGARAIAGAEHEGALELLLANPVPRARVALQRGVGVMLLTAALATAAIAVLLLLAPPLGLLAGIGAGRMIEAGAAATALGLLHAGIAFGVGAGTGRHDLAVALGAAVAVGGYLLYGFVTAAPVLAPLRWASAWAWYADRNVLHQGVNVPAMVTMLALGLAFAAVGGVIFTHRDLR